MEDTDDDEVRELFLRLQNKDDAQGPGEAERVPGRPCGCSLSSADDAPVLHRRGVRKRAIHWDLVGGTT